MIETIQENRAKPLQVYGIMPPNQSKPRAAETAARLLNTANHRRVQLMSDAQRTMTGAESTPVIKCATCGALVLTKVNKTGLRYCSRLCCGAAKRVAVRRPRTRRMVSFRCHQCGALSLRDRNARLFKYCSVACNGASHMRRADENFWPMVDKSGDCWIWTGGRQTNGYGRVSYQGRRVPTHRLSWVLANGPIPDGLCVLHNCPTGDNPLCCNPDHLFLGTKVDNMRDMAAKGRASKGEAHHWARRSEGDVLRIIVLRFAGWSNRAIAAYFSMPLTSVESIVYGRGWRHLGYHK